jgi:hypothetical protein
MRNPRGPAMAEAHGVGKQRTAASTESVMKRIITINFVARRAPGAKNPPSGEPIAPVRPGQAGQT